MARRLSWIGALLLMVLAVGAVQAQEAEIPTNGWRATYWNNPSVAGPWLVQRVETDDLLRDWGEGPPAEGMNQDFWSARWERTIRVAAGTYRFSVTVDNGVRIWVDGELLLNEWEGQWLDRSGAFVADIDLEAGPHLLQVDYFDTVGPASLQLAWNAYTGPSLNTEQTAVWRAEYFNDTDLGGAPVLVRDEPVIDVSLGPRSPAPGTVNADNFSVRWRSSLDLDPGAYRFTVRVDDGGRLDVGGRRVIDAWIDQGPTTYTATVDHEGGRLPVIMEYYERRGYAVAQLSWERVGDASVDATPTPEPLGAEAADSRPPSSQAIAVDDGDDGFNRGGIPQAWDAGAGRDGDSLLSGNHASNNGSYNWARWYPNLQAGRYEVLVYIPAADNLSNQARYWLAHGGQYTLQVVDQAGNQGSWVSLGIYEFSGGPDEYLSLADVTLEPTGSRRVVWDSARWEPMP